MVSMYEFNLIAINKLRKVCGEKELKITQISTIPIKTKKKIVKKY